MSFRGLGVQVCNSHVPNTELYVSRSPSVRPSFTFLPEIAPFSTSVHSRTGLYRMTNMAANGWLYHVREGSSYSTDVHGAVL